MKTAEVTDQLTVGQMATLIVLAFPIGLLRAWVAMRIYGWFAPIGWPQVDYAAFVGLVLLIDMMRPVDRTKPIIKQPVNIELFKIAFKATFNPVLTLLFASAMAFLLTVVGVR